ncbi:helix-turn-helix domain-containing protein [Bdellovibrio sp. NC01]|uniref:helix-turn-helix domain-containing protein n=1 Tax=Bdellovibrio sp. NC01 TaxID=2220073 RepID=UPI0011572BB6|nr:helix-turn-helix transcriptional regulator [Bdellovibrio sp. NC01]QDK37980.1 hypothetical protein DOE51_10470 [Bdellovibrio sp. NC01]
MEFCAIKKIGYILRFYRRQKGLSQIDMAESLGVSSRNYQRLELGEVEPRLETLSRISKVLDISLSSLIRVTDSENLSIGDLATANEQMQFRDLNLQTQSSDQDLQLAERLIAKDRLDLPTSELSAQLKGTTANLSDNLAKLVGASAAQIDIQPYVLEGSAVERWELVFRMNLKRALIRNSYLFPNGFIVFEEYHHSLNPNPDNPTSEIYIRDITARHNLEIWLAQQRLKKAFA